MSATGRFEVFLMLMMAAVVLETFAYRLRLPRVSVLIAGGIVIALAPGLPSVEFDPDLIMMLFLPPLLLSSAYQTIWSDFKANFRIIIQLATGAVLLTTIVVGAAAHWLRPDLPWAACFALGAILSPPDAVAAKAVLRRFPLPPRIVVLLEGESLINDASGLVLLRFAVAAAMTGTFDAGRASLTFVYVVVAGIVIGILLGYMSSWVSRFLSDARLNVVWSFLLAWAAYLIGEFAGASGVLATVACGVMVAGQQHKIFSARTRVQARSVWDVAEFVMESLVFIIIGLSLRGVLARFGGDWAAVVGLVPSAIVIFIALVLARAAWIFPATYIPRAILPQLRHRDPFPSVLVPALVSWAGMRGVVSLAAALSLPSSFPGRDFILVVTFCVIGGTIFFLGSTLAPLARSLAGREFTLKHRPTLSDGELRARLARVELETVRNHVTSGTKSHDLSRLVQHYEWRAHTIDGHPEVISGQESPQKASAEAILLAIAASRAELLKLYRQGTVQDNLMHQIEEELDLEELSARMRIDR